MAVKNKILPIFPFCLWLLATIFFFMQHFVRLAPSVMVPNLMHVFSINAFDVGNIMAFFFYGYIIAQLPAGLIFDRFEVRKVLAWAALFAGISIAAFAVIITFKMAIISRFILGIFSAFAFIGALKTAATYFSEKRFGLLAGITQGAGMVGAAFGEFLILRLIRHISWQYSFLWIGSVFFIVSFVFFSIHQNKTSGFRQKTKMHLNFLQVLGNKQSWFNALYAGMMLAPMVAFSESWAPIFLSTVYHISPNTATMADSTVFIACTIGSIMIGFLSDHMQRRKPLMIFSAFCCLIFLSIILYAPSLNDYEIFVLLFIFGLTNTGFLLAYASSAEANTREVSGTAIAFANMSSILLGTLLQPFIGWLLDFQWQGKIVNGIRYYNPSSFRYAMLPLFIYIITACIIVFFIKETRCRYAK